MENLSWRTLENVTDFGSLLYFIYNENGTIPVIIHHYSQNIIKIISQSISADGVNEVNCYKLVILSDTIGIPINWWLNDVAT